MVAEKYGSYIFKKLDIILYRKEMCNMLIENQEKGYRIIRIKANKKDDIPTKEQIKEAVDYLVKGNHHLTFIDMNI